MFRFRLGHVRNDETEGSVVWILLYGIRLQTILDQFLGPDISVK